MNNPYIQKFEDKNIKNYNNIPYNYNEHINEINIFQLKNILIITILISTIIIMYLCYLNENNNYNNNINFARCYSENDNYDLKDENIINQKIPKLTQEVIKFTSQFILIK